MLPPVTDDGQQRWAEDQRAMARALGLSLEQWLKTLDRASRRQTGLTAAVIGAAMAKGHGMGVLADLDGPALAQRARRLIDPAPPRAKNPILREAIRRASDLPEGEGLDRLRQRREEIRTPHRAEDVIPSASAGTGTADAPGEPE